MFSRLLLFFFCLFFYGVNFISYEQTIKSKPTELHPPPPVNLLQVTTGYFKQVTAEILFIKTSVFLGGVQAGVNAIDYETNLAINLKTISNLYPEFTDTYLFTESFLAPISIYSVKEANKILETGIKTYPDNFIYRFFHAFNSYRYLEKPLEAAKAFEEGAKLKGAPPMFAHLAVIFSARGGHLTAGMSMLRSMLNGEQNEVVKKRYREELYDFEQAIAVQNALAAFQRDKKKFPQQLKELIPEYLTNLPVIEKRFVLMYDPPNLYLKRPK